MSTAAATEKAAPLTDRGRRTREKLLAAAREVFEQRGYASTRMADIARAAGVSVGAPDPAAALAQDTLVVLDALRKPAQQLDLDAWRSGLEALEGDWFAPLAEAFRTGRIDTLHLTAPGDRGTLQLELRRSERWKFWRKPYGFDALLKSIAPVPMPMPHHPGPTDAPL